MSPPILLSAVRAKTLKAKQVSPNPFRSIAPQRDASDPDAQFQSWPILQEASHGVLKCCFTVEPKYTKGILGHLVVTIVDDVDLLVCLGFDHSFRPICIVIPFCKQIYNRSLRPGSALRTYYEILPDNYTGCEMFDSASHIAALRGVDGVVECSMPGLGLEIEIMEQLGTDGKYEASIHFNAEEFLRQYLPDLEVAEGDEHSTYPQNAVQRLLEIESALLPSRKYL